MRWQWVARPPEMASVLVRNDRGRAFKKARERLAQRCLIGRRDRTEQFNWRAAGNGATWLNDVRELELAFRWGKDAVCSKLHARAGRRCVALRTQAAVTFAPALIACPASKISGHCLSLCVCVLTTRSSLTLPSSGHSGKVSRLSVTAACRRLPCCSELWWGSLFGWSDNG